MNPADDPCAGAGIVLLLTPGSDSVWRGDSNLSPPRQVVSGQECHVDFAEPLGTFSAPGECR